MGNGEQDVFEAALTGGEMPATGETPNLGEDTSPALDQPAPQATPEPESEPEKAPQRSESEAYVPSWRLREVAEEKRRAEEEKRRYEQELAELRAWKEQIERERQEAQKQAPDIFEDPDAFLQHKAQELLDPVQKAAQVAEERARAVAEYWSRQYAIKEFGQETVDKAFAALQQAIASGELNRDVVLKQLREAADPFGDIVRWHRKYEFEREVGSDPQAWLQKQKEALLNDPEFLAKAVEAARARAVAVETTATAKGSSVTGLPSLNRTPRAGTEFDEPEDPAEVFNAALAGGGRR